MLSFGGYAKWYWLFSYGCALYCTLCAEKIISLEACGCSGPQTFNGDCPSNLQNNQTDRSRLLCRSCWCRKMVFWYDLVLRVKEMDVTFSGFHCNAGLTSWLPFYIAKDPRDYVATRFAGPRMFPQQVPGRCAFSAERPRPKISSKVT